MPRIRQIDIAVLDKIFGMEGGYVLRFSDRTMREFFAHDLNIDIDDQQYAVDGTSKTRRVRCFLRLVDAPTAVRVLHALSVKFVSFVRTGSPDVRGWTRRTPGHTPPARKIYLKEGFPCRAGTGYMLSSQRLTALEDISWRL